MKDMRKPVTWLLLIALFVSSSAVAATLRLVGIEQAATQISVVDAHSQHRSAQHGSQSTPQDAQETYAHHYVAQGDNSAPADCPCCDDVRAVWMQPGGNDFWATRVLNRARRFGHFAG